MGANAIVSRALMIRKGKNILSLATSHLGKGGEETQVESSKWPKLGRWPKLGGFTVIKALTKNFLFQFLRSYNHK